MQSAEVEGRPPGGGDNSGTNPNARRRINYILLGTNSSDEAYDIVSFTLCVLNGYSVKILPKVIILQYLIVIQW